MNLFALSGILIAVANGVLALLMFVLAKKRLHYIWLMLCVAAAVWGVGVYKIAIAKEAEEALLWWRIAHIGVILIPVFFTHFVFEFLGKSLRVFGLLLYGSGLFFLAFNLYDTLFIANVRWVFNQFYYDSPPTTLYILFTAWFFALVVCSHYFLARAYAYVSEHTKTQISYFFLATTLGFIGGATAFLPVYGIDIYPYGNLMVAFYTLLITYAIFAKQLFGIRVVLVQLLVGFIGILLFLNAFISDNLFEYVWKGTLFTAFLGAGYLLIRTFFKQQKQKEELERLAADLSAANEQLTTLDKAKSEFIAIASHQLRTPLTAIKGYISLLMEGTYGALREKQKKPMNGVFQSAERLIRLVNDLLSISRIESGKIEAKLAPTDIKKLIEGVIEELRMKVEGKGLTLDLENSHGAMPVIMADEEKIRNVLMNIIDNAIRYTSKGGITVCLKLEEAERRIRIEIKDTGEGMTQEEMSKLFESFSRGTAGQRIWTEGAGLGLYIAKKFIEMHKGRVWAESEGKGKGSEFVIELPIA